jgi:hypothetical protein
MDAQEEINKQADAVFNGARTDKPGKSETAEEESDDEVTVTAVKGDTKFNSFIAINGNGNGESRAGSAAASKTAKAVLKLAAEEDEDTIVVVKDDEDDTIVVGEAT